MGLLIGFTLSQVLLMVLAVYFAFHITQIIGRFWAWSFLIATFCLFAVRDASSLASLLAMSPDQLAARTEQFDLQSIWPTQLVTELAYASLAAGMFGLSRIFSGKGPKIE